MTKDIQSNNTSDKPLIRQFLGLSLPQFLLNLLIGGLALALMNARALWHYFNNSILAEQQADLSGTIDQSSNWLGDFLHSLGQSRLPQLFFWLLLGCIVYIIIWLLRNFVNNIRNDLVASHFVRSSPGENPSDSGDYWRPILLRKIFFVVSVSVLLGFMFTAFKLLSVFADLCNWAVSNFRSPQSILEIVGATLAVAFLLQILLILGHITIRSWKSINNDL